MLTMMDRAKPAVDAVAAAAALDEPACIFAALIDGLASTERYTIEARNGELFITPARRSYGPVLRVEKAAA
jgi:hypothetical protein